MSAYRYAVVSVLVAAVVSVGVTVRPGAAAAGMLAWFGVAMLAVGIAAGAPVLVVVGVLGPVLSTVMVAATGGNADGPVIVAAPLLWLSYECAWRSIELRPRTVPDGAAAAGWLGLTLLMMGGSLALGLAIVSVTDAAPDGGLAFRLAGVGVVVSIAVLLALMNHLQRRFVAAGHARVRGSGEQRLRTTRRQEP